jgi:hypothetical protein
MVTVTGTNKAPFVAAAGVLVVAGAVIWGFWVSTLFVLP